MFSAEHIKAAAASFKAENPKLVAAADAKGLNWLGLLQTFGPLVLSILETLLTPAATPAPVPAPTPAPTPTTA